MFLDDTEEVSCAGDLEEVASKWKPREIKVPSWRGNLRCSKAEKG